jgi:hypothetical protein
MIWQMTGLESLEILLLFQAHVLQQLGPPVTHAATTELSRIYLIRLVFRPPASPALLYTLIRCSTTSALFTEALDMLPLSVCISLAP